MARKTLFLAFSERSQIPQSGTSGARIPQTIGGSSVVCRTAEVGSTNLPRTARPPSTKLKRAQSFWLRLSRKNRDSGQSEAPTFIPAAVLLIRAERASRKSRASSQGGRGGGPAGDRAQPAGWQSPGVRRGRGRWSRQRHPEPDSREAERSQRPAARTGRVLAGDRAGGRAAGQAEHCGGELAPGPAGRQLVCSPRCGPGA